MVKEYYVEGECAGGLCHLLPGRARFLKAFSYSADISHCFRKPLPLYGTLFAAHHFCTVRSSH